jgi:hypothetical protein
LSEKKQKWNPDLFRSKAKELSLPGYPNKNHIDAEGLMSRSSKDHRRRVSQLKKHLCYDNSNFDKKRYGKLKQAGVLDVFALVSVEIYF